ncbi:MAG: hypothetical protein AB1410_07785 [Acidobacteriota bacterium]
MKKNFFIFFVIITFLSVSNLNAIDLTGFGGFDTETQEKIYGISLGWSMFPFARLELEGFRYVHSPIKNVSGNIVVTFPLKNLRPYLAGGIGYEGEKFDLDLLSRYRSYGGGVILSMSELLSMRFDYRTLKFKDYKTNRIYAGLFFSF